MSIFSKKERKDDPVLAVSIVNPVSSGIYRDLLKENGIPFLCKQQGAGGYLKILVGGGFVPDCYYVAPEDLDRAKELYEVYLGTEVEPEEE